MASPFAVIERSFSKKSYGFNRGIFKRNKKRKSSETVSKAPVIVTWDHVKCRPIYSSEEATVAAIDTDSDEEEEEENVVEEPQPEAHGWNATTQKKRTNKKHKTYGGSSKRHLFRQTFGTNIAATNTHDLSKPPLLLQSKGTGIVVPCKSPLTPAHASICDALSVTKASQVATTTTTTRADGMVLKRRTKASTISKKSGVFDYHDTTTTSVSANTDVSAARAYFDRLDAQQRLTVENATSSNSSTCIRTPRPVGLEGTELQDEYQAYCQYSIEDVAPVSLKDYADNRSAFFRPNQMYEGFLDG